MPRFFMHIRDGSKVILDREGSELPDLASAREEAIESAREMLADGIRFGRNVMRYEIDQRVWSCLPDRVRRDRPGEKSGK